MNCHFVSLPLAGQKCSMHLSLHLSVDLFEKTVLVEHLVREGACLWNEASLDFRQLFACRLCITAFTFGSIAEDQMNSIDFCFKSLRFVLNF
jgi:hypothetical protein